MSKWFVEVVKNNFNGKYHANMMVDGKVVGVLARDMDYNTLREDIRVKTGIELPKKKDMQFWTYDGKSYAILDFTRDRDDHRVTQYEVMYGRPGWRPDFDVSSEWVGKQVVLGPVRWDAEGFEGIYVDIGTVEKYNPAVVGERCGRAGSFSVHRTDRLYLSGLWVALDKMDDYRLDLPLYSSGAMDIAKDRLLALRDEVDALLEMPVVQEPDYKGIDPFKAYFEVLNVKRCSDEQLVVADYLAKKYIGPQAPMRKDIQGEMVARFKERTAPTLEERLVDASRRSFVCDASGAAGTRSSELGTKEGIAAF